MTDHATHTLATLRATIRRLALPASFALQPEPDWDALIAEQDAIEAARGQAPRVPSLAPPATPTATTLMPARALQHARRTGWEEVR